jgi:membrane-associated protease RseP (regulator of RpoE activity)
MSFNLYLILFIILGFWGIMNYFSASLKDRGVEVVGFTLLWRTKKFMGVIDNLSKKFGKFWDYFAKFGIIASLFGCGYIIYFLFNKTLEMARASDPQPVATLVIPGVTIPLWYGLIGIVTLVIVHEFAHGIVARRENIPLKSVGAGVFIALPLAFVEPEEEEMKKASPWARIKVYGAGSTANFALGLITLLLLMSLNPMITADGIEIDSVQEEMPAYGVLEKGMIIYEANGIEFKNATEFSDIMSKFEPGDKIALKTNKGVKEIILTENPEDPTRGYIGIYSMTHLTTKYGSFLLPVYFSLYWISMLNINIGLINLLPIPPVLDGGKIVKELMEMKVSKRVSKTISAILAVISISLVVIAFFPKILVIL